MFTYSFFLINFAGMKILITGATGFIGSFIVEEALNRGMEVWAAVRGTSSRQYVSDERINFIELNLDSEEQLRTALAPHKFDYVVHAAGVTKCLNRNDFFRVNTEGTKHLVNALLALQMPMKKFVYLSSLSVFGPAREQMPYREITDKAAASVSLVLPVSRCLTARLPIKTLPFQTQHTDRVNWLQRISCTNRHHYHTLYFAQRAFMVHANVTIS